MIFLIQIVKQLASCFCSTFSPFAPCLSFRINESIQRYRNCLMSVSTKNMMEWEIRSLIPDLLS